VGRGPAGQAPVAPASSWEKPCVVVCAVTYRAGATISLAGVVSVEGGGAGARARAARASARPAPAASSHMPGWSPLPGSMRRTRARCWGCCWREHGAYPWSGCEDPPALEGVLGDRELAARAAHAAAQAPRVAQDAAHLPATVEHPAAETGGSNLDGTAHASGEAATEGK